MLKFARIYFHYIKFIILISLILVAMLLQSVRKVDSENVEYKMRNTTISPLSFNFAFIILTLFIGFTVKQIIYHTLF